MTRLSPEARSLARRISAGDFGWLDDDRFAYESETFFEALRELFLVGALDWVALVWLREDFPL